MRAKKFLAIVAMLVGTSVAASAAHVDVGIGVAAAPPPPLVETVPVGVAPGPGYVWVNGYWGLGGHPMGSGCREDGSCLLGRTPFGWNPSITGTAPAITFIAVTGVNTQLL